MITSKHITKEQFETFQKFKSIKPKPKETEQEFIKRYAKESDLDVDVVATIMNHYDFINELKGEDEQ